MEFKDVKEFIESNKDNEEVSAYLQGFKQLSVDEVQKYISESEEGKKWLDSERDRHFSKGLETWKNNNLEKIVNDEIRKRNPEKTQEQIELEQVRRELENIKNEKVRESLKNKALTVASEKKIPHNLVDFLLGQDEDSTLSNLSTFEETMQGFIKSEVEDRLKGTYEPPSGGEKQVSTTQDFFSAIKENQVTR